MGNAYRPLESTIKIISIAELCKGLDSKDAHERDSAAFLRGRLLYSLNSIARSPEGYNHLRQRNLGFYIAQLADSFDAGRAINDRLARIKRSEGKLQQTFVIQRVISEAGPKIDDQPVEVQVLGIAELDKRALYTNEHTREQTRLRRIGNYAIGGEQNTLVTTIPGAEQIGLTPNLLVRRAVAWAVVAPDIEYTEREILGAAYARLVDAAQPEETLYVTEPGRDPYAGIGAALTDAGFMPQGPPQPYTYAPHDTLDQVPLSWLYAYHSQE